MNTEEAIAIVDEALEKVSRLRSSNPYSADHVEFMQTTGMELARIFGPDSVIAGNFIQVRYQFKGSKPISSLNWKREIAITKHRAYLQGLDMAEGLLRSARTQLEQYGAEEMLSASRLKISGAKVFISHGTETKALDKVERFIRAMGLKPVIVVREASEGKAVDDLVEIRMVECDCVVILATADDQVDDRMQPRLNVIHEIGLAQEKFDNKVIYLKEVGCEFPSNIRPKVWESFTQDNMEAAFEKVVKEFRAFGVI